MTSAEWAEAFRTGDPEKIGQTIHRALRQAGAEIGTQSEPSWDDLGPHVQRQLVRTGEILREWGCLVLAGPEVTE